MDDHKVAIENELDESAKSLGSGLDEIAFKPLGRRIEIRVGNRGFGRVKRPQRVDEHL